MQFSGREPGFLVSDLPVLFCYFSLVNFVTQLSFVLRIKLTNTWFVSICMVKHTERSILIGPDDPRKRTVTRVYLMGRAPIRHKYLHGRGIIRDSGKNCIKQKGEFASFDHPTFIKNLKQFLTKKRKSFLNGAIIRNNFKRHKTLLCSKRTDYYQQKCHSNGT